jgi:Domain of unknown function (DUF5753)/Domain of unknown function (DUF397)
MLAVMRTQLRRLIDMAEHSNVTLQVLPFTAAAHVQPISPFTILEFPDGPKLVISPAAWSAFVTGVRHGEFGTGQAPLVALSTGNPGRA